MELDAIRKQLDQLDQSLDYIILLRLSLAILVGKVKEEQHLPIYQSAREEKIYSSQKSFSEQTGANPEALTRVFKELIAAAIRIESNLGEYQFEIKEDDLSAVGQALGMSNQVLGDFISHMDSVKETLHKSGIEGNKLLASLSKYYENVLSDSNGIEL